ncbi:ABC transporter permease [Paenibacillus alginolyticus]|uniref:ABC transporter permease n=2 Tax=Paenibacillus alginolyticus TaxID=59839 RepID=A0ABT4GKX3_9BACL|nr:MULTISPECIES: methionine ABC transporter permease [Paenibacillus]MCY9668975.1 ABC transporter permease [Paenibacillus alginolyticus]MCY9696857.1 ABC transporter permease [Paenibacillus alginolyticus]MEC0147629.1 ABC transporter permease [Paenibacillus alginolyticus]NRF89497.1 ABC transporter permease [Paenibacillus frigoriresistens]
MTWDINWSEIMKATGDTLVMLGWSLLFTVIIGMALGIILFLTSKGQLLQNLPLYGVLSLIVNILRSVPFVILMISVFPITKAIVHTTIGVQGAIPPLVIAAAPFLARLVETALREIDSGVIEAAQSMGATPWQIVWRVLMPEARPGLISAVTVTAVALLSYSAMSGVVGGGGLGDLSLRYGYMRFRTDIMIVTVVILVLFVQLLQMLGDRLVVKFNRK